jgi:hypothetical protein
VIELDLLLASLIRKTASLSFVCFPLRFPPGTSFVSSFLASLSYQSRRTAGVIIIVIVRFARL